MIKKSLTLVGVAVVLLVLGLLVANHWQNQENKNKHEAAIAQEAARQAQAKEQATAQADRAKLVTQYNGLLVECQKGKASYDQLPKFLQKPIQNPKCGTVLH